MKGRGFQILLICSLILNVFAIGGIVGAAISWRQFELQRPVAAGLGRAGRLREAAMALSQQYRRGLRQTIRETMSGLQPDIEQARVARIEAGRLLVQPRLDRPALQAALNRARAADIAIRVRLENAVVDFVAALPAGERAALARALTQSSAGAGAAQGARP
jgi:uncharacterized membrane protein